MWEFDARPCLAGALSVMLVCSAGLGATSARAADAPADGPPHGFAPPLPAIAPELDVLSNMTLPGGGRVSLTSTGDPDEDAVLAATRDMQTSGVLAARNHEAALLKVLANMPRPFERVRLANGVTEYRGDSMADCLAYGTAHGKSGSASLVCRGNPFPTAAFFLGSYYDEVGQPEKALSALDAGLVAAPQSTALIGERGAALIALHRLDDALADYDRGIAIENQAPTFRAKLFRGRGYVLTELKRLDEAEQAYVDSLKLDPNNPRANNELAYIATLRAGAAPSKGGLISVQPAPSR
jgi:tetratricopeptide (TPR) repeat protein